MDADEAILRSIAEELPYLEFCDLFCVQIKGKRPGLKILRDDISSNNAAIIILDNFLHIYLWNANIKIDLNTTDDLVKVIDHHIRSHCTELTVKDNNE